MLTWKARSVAVAAFRQYGVMLLLSSSLLLAGKCAAQETGSQPAGQNSSSKPDAEKQGQTPDTSPNAPQAGSEPAEQGTVAKVQAGMNAGMSKIMDLPGEWFLGAYVPANRNLQPLDNRGRVRVYVQQTFLTGASYLKRLGAAGVDQARGVPSEWGGGMGGYGERFGSRYGQFIIQNTLTSAGDAILRYEPRYDLCRCEGFWPRTRHAMWRNFVTYNSTERERKPQVPLYLASFGAGALATTWKPASQNPWRNGGYAVLGQAGYGAISNWLQEFALDLGRKLSRHKGANPGA
jgi:hypothetical protein